MSVSISTAFVKQYEGDVHVAYQRQGAKMRNSCRMSSNVVGETAVSYTHLTLPTKA